MPDVDRDRQGTSRFVFSHLRDAKFRECLTATASDGSKPIVIALPSDLATRVLDEVSAVGGVANVILPVANGVMIYAMTNESTANGPETPGVQVLSPTCTVGVFLARVMEDGGKGEYCFAVEGRVGHASLAGVAS